MPPSSTHLLRVPGKPEHAKSGSRLMEPSSTLHTTTHLQPSKLLREPQSRKSNEEQLKITPSTDWSQKTNSLLSQREVQLTVRRAQTKL